MTDLRTAAQQALERLRKYHYGNGFVEDAECIAALEAALAQQDEPVTGKVVAWGVFANIDGEWQLQHPVFAGDEQGKANAEFERASYSGPQPLEVRPLGVVTATAQQAGPVEPAKPVAQQAKPLTGLDMFLDPADGLKPKPYKPRAEPVLQTRKDGHYSVAYRCKCGHEQNVTEIVQGGRTYAGSGANWCDGCGDGPPVRVDAMQQQAEPVEPVGWNWMLDGQPYGQAYYGNPPDTDIAERAAIAGRTVRLLYTAPPRRTMVPLTDEEIERIGMTHQSLRQVARAVEKASWEKNHG